MSELAVRGREFREEFSGRRERLFALAPRWLRDEEAQAAWEEALMMACWNAPGLLEPQLRKRLWRAVYDAVRLGLEVGGPLGQCYLIPYKHDVTLVPGYKGLKELAYRSRRVQLIDSDAVYEDDYFEVQLGSECRLVHRPNLEHDASGDLKAVWALAKLTNGQTVVRVMSKRQVDAHRAKFVKNNRTYDNPWQTAYAQMAQKTVLLRLYKLLPLPTRMQSLVQAGEYAEAGVARGPLRSGDKAPAADLDAVAARLEQEADPPAAAPPLEPDPEQLQLIAGEIPF